MSALTASTDAEVVSGRRVARKVHRCQGQIARNCAGLIGVGEVYLESVVFPGHDVAGRDRPSRMRSCAPCALRYSDAGKLDPIPYEQCVQQGLL